MEIALIDGDVLLHSALWKTTSIEEAKTKLQFTYEEWMTQAFLENSIIALGVASDNYRLNLYPEYKHSVSRDKSREKQVSHKKDLWKFLSKWENTAVCSGIEADDQIGIWKTQLGDDAVIVSVDKDLRQLGGRFFYSKLHKYRSYIVTQEEADRFFLSQMLTGDPMDHIPGIPGLGPKKVELIVQSEPTVEALSERVIDEYKKRFGDEWESYFLSNGKMLFIQRCHNDWFSLNRYRQLFCSKESNDGSIARLEDGSLAPL